MSVCLSVFIACVFLCVCTYYINYVFCLAGHVEAGMLRGYRSTTSMDNTMVKIKNVSTHSMILMNLEKCINIFNMNLRVLTTKDYLHFC